MRDDGAWMFNALLHRKSGPSRLLSICFSIIHIISPLFPKEIKRLAVAVIEVRIDTNIMCWERALSCPLGIAYQIPKLCQRYTVNEPSRKPPTDADIN